MTNVVVEVAGIVAVNLFPESVWLDRAARSSVALVRTALTVALVAASVWAWSAQAGARSVPDGVPAQPCARAARLTVSWPRGALTPVARTVTFRRRGRPRPLLELW